MLPLTLCSMGKKKPKIGAKLLKKTVCAKRVMAYIFVI